MAWAVYLVLSSLILTKLPPQLGTRDAGPRLAPGAGRLAPLLPPRTPPVLVYGSL